MITSLASLAGTVVVTVGLLAPTSAAQSHPTVVDDDPANDTPQLVPTGAVGQPRTDALAELDGTVFAGGWFESVSQGGTTYVQPDQHRGVRREHRSGPIVRPRHQRARVRARRAW
jgi:hypothetical protein